MRTTHFKIISLTLVLLLAGASRAHGLDVAGMDKSVNPGDDFFAYANGVWLKETKIPEDRASYGVFDALAEEANQQTADLIREAGKSAAGPEARLVGDT